MNKERRECERCTKCCDGWLQTTVRDIPVHIGSPCPHSTGKGCNDYENRPTAPCRNFYCGWVIPNSPLPDWLKPSVGKVIVIFNKMNWRGIPVDLAVPVGKKIPSASLEWLKKFAEQQGRPLIYTEQIGENGHFQKEQNVLGHGPLAFQQDLSRRLKDGEKLW